MENFKERAIAAERLWLSGKLEEATKSYLKIIRSLDESDRGLEGGFLINIGLIAEEASQWQAAVKSYQAAISVLDGMDSRDDESGHQCANAHYNIARILRAGGNDKYKVYAQRAIERYQANPLASATDIRDAKNLLKSGKTLKTLLLVIVILVIVVVAWRLFF